MAQSPNRFYNLATKGGLPSNIRPAPLCVFQKTLTANTNVSITVPSTTNASGAVVPANYVTFSCTNNFWAIPSTTGTATAAMADATDGTASELNPAAWGLQLQPDGTGAVLSIGLIAPNSSTIVTMCFYLQD